MCTCTVQANKIGRGCLSTLIQTGKMNVNGADLFFEKHGESPSALLCIPGGLGSTQSDFAPQLKHFSDEYTVVAFDPRGYGKSQPPVREFLEDYFQRDAEDAAELMKRLGEFVFLDAKTLITWTYTVL